MDGPHHFRHRGGGDSDFELSCLQIEKQHRMEILPKFVTYCAYLKNPSNNCFNKLQRRIQKDPLKSEMVLHSTNAFCCVCRRDQSYCSF